MVIFFIKRTDDKFIKQRRSKWDISLNTFLILFCTIKLKQDTIENFMKIYELAACLKGKWCYLGAEVNAFDSLSLRKNSEMRSWCQRPKRAPSAGLLMGGKMLRHKT